MINATCEADFLMRGLRALIQFRLHSARAWLVHGHVIRARGIARYMADHPVRKLHLGATQKLDGFLNSSVVGQYPIDVTCPLPLPDASFHLIFASHLIEHIHRRQFAKFLVECHRVLKPGGIAAFATPSLKKVATTLYGPDSEARNLLLERGRKHSWEGFHTPNQYLNTVIRAFGHRWLFDEDYIREAGKRAGFSMVSIVENSAMPDAALQEYVRRHKPAAWLAETETYLLQK